MVHININWRICQRTYDFAFAGLEESIIRAICAQLLAPLDFLHKNGRIFRDLKAKVQH